ncbi:unnamed protein product [marine sediment metagenome]|uniref:J domain-containing protein n=1 Tax=marine sediment metagenome TaxID=412755 RepID=X1R7B4_9ZZZZ
MATKSGARKVKRVLRNTDDILYILTGKRLRNVAGRTINAFGADLTKKVSDFFAGPEEEELPPDSPYHILGIHPDAMDIVVKASFRALARKYHPDVNPGNESAEEKFKQINNAYSAILRERKAKAETKKEG